MLDKDKYAKAVVPECFSRSEMLNIPGHHSVASVVATADKWSGLVQISDCSRSISLEVGWNSEADWANSLFKLDTLIDVLKEERKEAMKRGRQKGYTLS